MKLFVLLVSCLSLLVLLYAYFDPIRRSEFVVHVKIPEIGSFSFDQVETVARYRATRCMPGICSFHFAGMVGLASSGWSYSAESRTLETAVDPSGELAILVPNALPSFDRRQLTGLEIKFHPRSSQRQVFCDILLTFAESLDFSVWGGKTKLIHADASSRLPIGAKCLPPGVLLIDDLPVEAVGISLERLKVVDINQRFHGYFRTVRSHNELPPFKDPSIWESVSDETFLAAETRTFHFTTEYITAGAQNITPTIFPPLTFFIVCKTTQELSNPVVSTFGQGRSVDYSTRNYIGGAAWHKALSSADTCGFMAVRNEDNSLSITAPAQRISHYEYLYVGMGDEIDSALSFAAIRLKMSP